MPHQWYMRVMMWLAPFLSHTPMQSVSGPHETRTGVGDYYPQHCIRQDQTAMADPDMESVGLNHVYKAAVLMTASDALGDGLCIGI